MRQAGLAYLGGGAGIIVFTLAAGLVPPARARFLLFPGLGFVLLFGVALVLAPRLWHRPRSVRRALRLVRVLVVANAVRAVLFVLSAFGWNFHLFRDGRPALFVVPSEPRPLFLVNAAAAAAIALLLIRALTVPPGGEPEWTRSRR